MNDKLLIIGNPEAIHIGSHLLQAAESLNICVYFCDVRDAYAGSRVLAKINWHLMGHYPNRLSEFSRSVINKCKEFCPKWIISIGLAPVSFSALKEIGELGIERLNYLTDDPWNPAHYAPWFLKTLPCYDSIFSTRRSNIDELYGIGCRNVPYLPFAYDPAAHFPQKPSEEERLKYECDVTFIGGADRDRVSYICRLIQAGFKVALYGGYWDRFSETKRYARGHVGPETIRKVVSSAKINLCLVRHANRDGNSMRTFEIPAMGGCMLTEDTLEHKEIFGQGGRSVIYFKDADQMKEGARFLANNEQERIRLAGASHGLIKSGKHTYKDRLMTMLGF